MQSAGTIDHTGQIDTVQSLARLVNLFLIIEFYNRIGHERTLG